MEMCALDFADSLTAIEHEMILLGWSLAPNYSNLFVREWGDGDIEIAVGQFPVIEYYPNDDKWLSVDFDFIYGLDDVEDVVTIEGLNSVLDKYGLPTTETLRKFAKLERLQRLGMTVVRRDHYTMISGLNIAFDI